MWKQGGSKEEYKAAKKAANRAVYVAKQQSRTRYFQDINLENDRNKIFKMARSMKEDVVGEKCVCNDDGNLTMSVDAMLQARTEYYPRLLNVEFRWEDDTLSDSEALKGAAMYKTEDMVASAITKMKCGKAAGPSGIVL